jgi:hypothetical protein
MNKTLNHAFNILNTEYTHILVFDESFYNHNNIEANRQHEQKAFFEWVADNDVKYEILPQIEDERRIVKIL